MTIRDLIKYRIEIENSNPGSYIRYSLSHQDILIRLYKNKSKSIISKDGNYDLAIFKKDQYLSHKDCLEKLFT